MKRDAYLSYLIHGLARWGKIGSHSIENKQKRTKECVSGIVDQLLICLYYGFPQVYKNLVQFVTKGVGQC